MSSSPDLQLESHLARFGLAAFRPGQREVISSVLAGRDCLCIMPTGGGKSLCYQLPAVARPGVTLVVSPLIALMKDQVDSLTQLGIAATFVNSTLTPQEQRVRLDQMAAGRFDLLYVAPERCRSPLFLEAVRASGVQLLAIDEAHCVSEWGHDFRPDYARLAGFRRRLGYPQTIALTATATPTVRQDVIAMLELRTPDVFVTGFARENLQLEVRSPYSNTAKDEELLELLKETPGAGIIYASTRKRCEELFHLLSREIERPVGLYHAGLLPDERRHIQEEFMSGRVPIIVATNAFGMGIDKADLRFVVHYNMPGSLEAYYQEAGRAGRDGLPSRCVLLFSYSDRYVQEFFIENSYPSRETVARVYNYLRKCDEDPIEVTLQELKERLDLPVGSEGVGACERLLEKCGAIERLDAQQNMAAVRIDSELPTLVDLLPKEAKVRRRVLQCVEKLVGEMRCERVYVQPRQVAAQTELALSSVVRALKALGELRDFDYVPPFRGRAIHMLQRDTPFDKLDIDFEELERRKQAEYDKLERVVGYARSRNCRQREILDYFGDPAKGRCGHCDNCPDAGLSGSAGASPSQDAGRDRQSAGQGRSSAEAPGGEERVLEAVRIALSGVARARGRFGKNVVAQMLCGSKSSKMSKFRLDRLSTYGLLADLKQSEVTELLDALIEAGLIEQSDVDRYRPVVQLTPHGSELMRGQEEAAMPPLPPTLRKRLQWRAFTAPSQPERRERAASGDALTPATRSAQVSDLAEAADRRSFERAGTGEPGTRNDRSGQAEASAAAAAPQYDDSECEFSDADDAPDFVAPAVARRNGQPPARRAGKDTAVGPKPEHYWTWRLLADGYSLEQCAAIRRLTAEQVLDHALRAADEGLEIDAAWLLSPPQLAVLETTIGAHRPRHIRPLLEQLPSDVTHQHVQLYLKCRSAASPSAP